jgi:hypothetical protein
MIDKSKRLRDLQARVSRGDTAAEGELRKELEPWMVLMVRRAMRLPGDGSPLEVLVQAELARLAAFPEDRQAAENPGLVRQIAQRICSTMIDRLRLTPAGYRGQRDTIRDWQSVRGSGPF